MLSYALFAYFPTFPPKKAPQSTTKFVEREKRANPNHESPESHEYFLLNLPILALNEPNQTHIFAPKSKHLISNL